MDLSEEEKRRLNLEFGKLAHQRHASEWHAIQRGVFDFALENIRTAALINGGAVIACFAFLGSIYDSDQASEVSKALMWPAILFAVGAGLSGLASLAAYLSMFASLQVKTAAKYAYTSYVVEAEGGWLNFWAGFWHFLAVGVIVTSYMVLGLGLHQVKLALWG